MTYRVTWRLKTDPPEITRRKRFETEIAARNYENTLRGYGVLITRVSTVTDTHTKKGR